MMPVTVGYHSGKHETTKMPVDSATPIMIPGDVYFKFRLKFRLRVGVIIASSSSHGATGTGTALPA